MSLVSANHCVATVDLIDVDELREQGIRCILVDRDNTLVPRDAKVAPKEVQQWLDRVRDAGITLCMVSNNFHTNEVVASADELGLEVVHHAMKPAPVALWLAMRVQGVPPEETVMVGDQLFTDMVAGNLAHVHTILVRPQSQQDLWYTQIFRKVEHFFLRDAVFDGEERTS